MPLRPGERQSAGRWQGWARPVSSRLSLPGQTGREGSAAAAGCAEVSGVSSPAPPPPPHICLAHGRPRPGEPNIPVSTQPPVRKARRFRAQGGGQGRVHTAGRAMALPHPEVPGGVSCPPLGDEAACPSPSQYEEKDKAFKEQLSQLATLLPTLQVRGAGGARLGTLTQRAPCPQRGAEQWPSHRFTSSSAPPSSAWPTRPSS